MVDGVWSSDREEAGMGKKINRIGFVEEQCFQFGVKERAVEGQQGVRF